MPCAVYQNFTFNNPTVTLSIIIWGAYIGFLLAGMLSIYHKKYLGAVVRALIKSGALSSETAISMEKAGVKAGLLRQRAVCMDGSLTRFVFIANPDECRLAEKEHSAFISLVRRFFTGSKCQPPKYNYTAARLYIPEEVRISAEIRYSAKGTSLPVFLIGAVLFLALSVLLIICIPYILGLIDSLIGMYSKLT